YMVTKEPIAEQKRLELLRALETTLPEYDNDPATTATSLAITLDSGETREFVFYYARMGQDVTGVAFVVIGQGFQSFIHVMLGINVDAEISGIEILEHAETPGLGALIEKESFKGQFKGKSLENSRLVAGNLAVTKDGGDVEAITGATISPRAIVQAVSEGLKFFEKHRSEILAGAEHYEPVE
ncbi:MAG: RnfABCDGE type electron transport complex subunit G, partial [bacterium]